MNLSKLAIEVEKKELKNKASDLFASGKLEKSMELYLQLWKLSPTDVRVRLKIGEILQKLGRVRESIAVYKKSVEAYAKEGFLIQAISVCKVILAMDPQEVETKNLLANLYAKRGLDKEPKVPVAKNAAVAEKAPEPNAEDLLDELFSEDIEVANKELPTIPLFSDLQKAEFQMVIDKLIPWKMPSRTVICAEGAVAESMFIIAQGNIRVSAKDHKGGQVELAILSAGEFFGEIGLFTKCPRTATCTAIEEVELLEITRNDFDDIIKKFPRLNQVLHDFYTTRVLDTVLAKSELFGLVNPQVRTELARKFSPREFQNGQMIVQEGDAGDALFLLRDGMVEVFTQKDGKDLKLAVMKAGDFFGEVALLTGKPRTASIRAQGRADVLILQKTEFDEALNDSPELKNLIETYVQKRVQDTLKAMQ